MLQLSKKEYVGVIESSSHNLSYNVQIEQTGRITASITALEVPVPVADPQLLSGDTTDGGATQETQVSATPEPTVPSANPVPIGTITLTTFAEATDQNLTAELLVSTLSQILTEITK